jgi:hypothetical protein
MHLEATTGRFGFHLAGGKDEVHPTSAFVQMYVKSSALSRVADLAISTHLMTAGEIDQFIREAVAALEALGVEAKKALAAANSNCRHDRK